MNRKQIERLVKMHKGWMEGEVARFPTPWHKEQFEQDLARIERLLA